MENWAPPILPSRSPIVWHRYIPMQTQLLDRCRRLRHASMHSSARRQHRTKANGIWSVNSHSRQQPMLLPKPPGRRAWSAMVSHCHHAVGYLASTDNRLATIMQLGSHLLRRIERPTRNTHTHTHTCTAPCTHRYYATMLLVIDALSKQIDVSKALFFYACLFVTMATTSGNVGSALQIWHSSPASCSSCVWLFTFKELARAYHRYLFF